MNSGNAGYLINSGNKKELALLGKKVLLVLVFWKSRKSYRILKSRKLGLFW
jgi:hypothetical protein